MPANDSRMVNSEISKKIKKIYADGLSRKHELRKEKKEEAKRRRDEGQDDGMEHADLNAPLKGVLGKGDNYARRAYNYIKGKDGRGVYKNFNFAHLEEIESMVSKIAIFPGGPKKNFNPTYTQKYPYNWEAHHLLPGSAFYYEIDGELVFTLKQIRLILQTDYNINHGHNLIFLPSVDWACPVHTLVCHPSDHPNWTMKIMDMLKEISRSLKRQEEKGEPHENIKTNVFEELKDSEEQAWDDLVQLSRVSVPAAWNDVRIVNDLVKFETKDGKTFDFPVLT